MNLNKMCHKNEKVQSRCFHKFDCVCGCSDEAPSHRESVEVLNSNADLTAHFMAVALQKLQQVADKGTCDGANCSKDKLFQHCCTLGRFVLKLETPS